MLQQAGPWASQPPESSSAPSVPCAVWHTSKDKGERDLCVAQKRGSGTGSGPPAPAQTWRFSAVTSGKVLPRAALGRPEGNHVGPPGAGVLPEPSYVRAFEHRLAHSTPSARAG